MTDTILNQIDEATSPTAKITLIADYLGSHPKLLEYSETASYSAKALTNALTRWGQELFALRAAESAITSALELHADMLHHLECHPDDQENRALFSTLAQKLAKNLWEVKITGDFVMDLIGDQFVHGFRLDGGDAVSMMRQAAREGLPEDISNDGEWSSILKHKTVRHINQTAGELAELAESLPSGQLNGAFRSMAALIHLNASFWPDHQNDFDREGSGRDAAKMMQAITYLREQLCKSEIQAELQQNGKLDVFLKFFETLASDTRRSGLIPQALAYLEKVPDILFEPTAADRDSRLKAISALADGPVSPCVEA